MAISKIGSKALVDCSVASADLEDGSITNAKLANSSITVNGTSVSLGASASLVDISWQSVITASGGSNTAVAGEGYFIDTTSNTHTVTLPASPSIGDKIAIKDYAGTFGTNNLTIGRNGNNIQGAANDSLISTNRASIILVYSDATKGWLYTVESNVADLEAVTYISATGGTVTTSGDYKIHTFTGDGCFVVSQGPSGPAPGVDYLVIAGGGGGGTVIGGNVGGGGAGAGGYRESCGVGYTSSPLGACVSALPVTATTYPVTVGGGGTSNPYPGPFGGQGTSGSNSVFSTITSAGGGAGGGGANRCNCAGLGYSGTPGGSGGGQAYGALPDFSSGTGNTPPVSPPQGQPGGCGTSSPTWLGAAGGGGATGAGGDGAGSPGGPDYTGGPGGAGATSSINNTPTVRASGGSGGSYQAPSSPIAAVPGGGGFGGPGSGGSGGAGTANTGGGGGGAGSAAASPTGGCGGTGGKGIVILRYKYQ